MPLRRSPEPYSVMIDSRMTKPAVPYIKALWFPANPSFSNSPWMRGAPQIGLAQPGFGPTCESTDTLADVLTL
jgi:hypothetical protein